MLRIFSRVFLAAVVLTAAFLGTLYSIAAPAPPARTSDEAGVRVIVTPKALGHDVKVLEFAVVMDTHVKPLNDDLMQTAVLIDSAGGRTSPTTWQGDPPGGHHRKGILQFSTPAENTKWIELTISGAGGVATRTFRWEVE